MPELTATPGQTIGPFFGYALPYPGGAPFFAVAVFARGLLSRLFTRIYLPAGPAILQADPQLATLGDGERRALVAAREGDGSLRFDVHLQGPLETPFLTFPRHAR
jgi:protocatechuate 3,4-dioxygenase, alpha subunit